MTESIRFVIKQAGKDDYEFPWAEMQRVTFSLEDGTTVRVKWPSVTGLILESKGLSYYCTPQRNVIVDRMKFYADMIKNYPELKEAVAEAFIKKMNK